MLEQQAAEPSVYTALQKEVIRAGVAKDSDKVGELPDGTTFTAIEGQLLLDGQLRVHFERFRVNGSKFALGRVGVGCYRGRRAAPRAGERAGCPPTRVRDADQRRKAA